MVRSCDAFVIILCFSGLFSADALRITSVSAPPVVPRNSDAVLRCDFNMGNDALYMVRWHHRDTEVFRYRPKDKPAVRVFQSPGINVDAKRSNATHLYLKGVNLAAGGSWVCEIVGEAPHFEADRGATLLQVVVFPNEVPIITKDKEMFEIGDLIHLSCASKPAYPPVNLTWYINGNIVLPESDRGYSLTRLADETTQTRISMPLRVNDVNFRAGNLKARCVASIKDIYWKVSEITLKVPGYQKVKANPLSSSAHRASFVERLPSCSLLLALYYNFIAVLY